MTVANITDASNNSNAANKDKKLISICNEFIDIEKRYHDISIDGETSIAELASTYSVGCLPHLGEQRIIAAQNWISGRKTEIAAIVEHLPAMTAEGIRAKAVAVHTCLDNDEGALGEEPVIQILYSLLKDLTEKNHH